MTPKIELGEAIEEFLSEMRAAGRAQKTLRWYGDILRRFAETAERFDRRALVAYLAARRETLAPASLAGEHRALRRFAKWMIERGYLERDPMREIARPVKSESVPRVATAQTALALAAVADNLRDRAIVFVLADTGARLSEFLAMTTDNLRITLHDGQTFGEAWVIGKGKRRRRLLIGPAAMSVLSDWIAERPPEAGGIIWWSERDEPLGPDGVRLVLKRLSKRAGLGESINPHAFRHGCAVDSLVAGADLRTVQLILGHSQIGTTVQYLKLADQLVTDAHTRVSDARFGTHPPARRNK